MIVCVFYMISVSLTQYIMVLYMVQFTSNLWFIIAMLMCQCILIITITIICISKLLIKRISYTFFILWVIYSNASNRSIGDQFPIYLEAVILIKIAHSLNRLNGEISINWKKIINILNQIGISYAVYLFYKN